MRYLPIKVCTLGGAVCRCTLTLVVQPVSGLLSNTAVTLTGQIPSINTKKAALIMQARPRPGRSKIDLDLRLYHSAPRHARFECT